MWSVTIILAVVVVLLMAVLFWKTRTPKDNGASLLLKQDLTNLSDDIGKLKEHLQVQINDRMDKNQELMRSSIEKQFEASGRIIKDVTQRLTELDKTNERVISVADELKVLQSVLQNPKQRGVLGEYYLSQVLENVLPPGRFKLQYCIGKEGGRDLICDAVVILDKGKLLPIDSKFSLENYNRLLEAKTKPEREALARAFKADIKFRIDETAKYIRPADGTMDYAFMFIPSEAIYYDLLVNKIGVTDTSARDMIEYAYREKNIIIVSPTTFMAYLQTVLQGLRSLQIEEQAKEIQKRVGELGRHIHTYEQFMRKLGNSLGTTVNHYNTAHKELKKIDKDVVKIADSEAKVEPLLLEKPILDE